MDSVMGMRDQRELGARDVHLWFKKILESDKIKKFTGKDKMYVFILIVKDN